MQDLLYYIKESKRLLELEKKISKLNDKVNNNITIEELKKEINDLYLFSITDEQK